MNKILRNITFQKYSLARKRLSTIAPNLDYDYICNPENTEEISNNIHIRKGVGDINIITELYKRLDTLPKDGPEYKSVQQSLLQESIKLPNRTHPEVLLYGETPKVVNRTGSERLFDFEPLAFDEIAKKLNLLRTSQLGNVTGERSYYIIGDLALLEQALIKYTLSYLVKNGFTIVSVPDILPRSIVESCGMNTKGERSQVYEINTRGYEDMVLSGTSEMALAGLFKDRILTETELPIKVASVSRCYREETSTIAEEKGIYRVHEFTKVEMFTLTTPEHSHTAHESLRTLQQSLFASLGLQLRTLDMPAHELGAPAYRKYDIEAWLPGRASHGEVSSCSNCTDYQSRRLNIRYSAGESSPNLPPSSSDDDSRLGYVHTLNGTACAIPRMLIALVETGQNSKGYVEVPEVLRGYIEGGLERFARQKRVPEVKLVKNKARL